MPNGEDCAIEWASAQTACDDDDACTIETTCSPAGCVGQALMCDDGNPCTLDRCLPEEGCVHDLEAQQGQSCEASGLCVDGVCIEEGETRSDSDVEGAEPDIAEDPALESASGETSASGCQQGGPLPRSRTLLGLLILLVVLGWSGLRGPGVSADAR